MKNTEYRIQNEEDEPEEWDECGFEKPPWLEYERTPTEASVPPAVAGSEPPALAGGVNSESVESSVKEETVATNQHEQTRGEPDSGITFHDGPRRSVYDLEKTFNAYGREIYVEEWEENSGRPQVWYEFNKQRVLVKNVRGPSGITHTYLGKSPYLQ